MGRLRELKPEEMTDSQKKVHESIAGGKRGASGGPFSALIYSPEMLSHLEQLGVYIRYNCLMPMRQRELVICMVGAHWHADFEWYVHAPVAREQGIPEDALKAIARRDAPDLKDELDIAAYEFASELMSAKKVSEATYQKAVQCFGEQAVVELTGLLGYYTLLAMTLNTFEIEVPDQSVIPWSNTTDDS